MTTSQWWCVWRRWSTLFVVSVTWEGQATTGAACTWHHCCGGLSLSPSTLSFSSTSSKQASVSSQCDPRCRIRNDRAVVRYDIIQSKFTNCILFQRRSYRFSADCCILFFLQSPFKFQQQNSQVAFCFRSDDEATDSLQAAASSFAQSLQFPAAQMDVISAFLTLTVS